MIRKLSLAIALAGAFSLAAFADDPTPDSHSDKHFFETAAVGGMAEVEIGNIAVAKASNPDVRAFAQRMVDDHGKNNTELAALARSEGIDLPTGLDDKHLKMKAELEAKSGAEFDRAYMDGMVKGHDEMIALFEQCAGGTKDDDIKSFADATLPTLREHRKHAGMTAAKVGAM